MKTSGLRENDFTARGAQTSRTQASAPPAATVSSIGAWVRSHSLAPSTLLET
jgi:hypothetical protein